jgi:hypothetical protein
MKKAFFDEASVALTSIFASDDLPAPPLVLTSEIMLKPSSWAVVIFHLNYFVSHWSHQSHF